MNILRWCFRNLSTKFGYQHRYGMNKTYSRNRHILTLSSKVRNTFLALLKSSNWAMITRISWGFQSYRRRNYRNWLDTLGCIFAKKSSSFLTTFLMTNRFIWRWVRCMKFFTLLLWRKIFCRKVKLLNCFIPLQNSQSDKMKSNTWNQLDWLPPEVNNGICFLF